MATRGTKSAKGSAAHLEPARPRAGCSIIRGEGAPAIQSEMWEGLYAPTGCVPRAQSGHKAPPTLLKTNRSIRAFSLIEVIVAVAVFAGAVTVILALLPALSGRATETADRLVAARLPDALHVGLARLAVPGFDALAAQAPEMGMPLDNGLAFVATREGARLHSRDYLPPVSGRIETGEQYFLIECWRFPDAPLRFESPQSSLALAVRVSWPYRLPGTSAPTPDDSRHELMFTVGVNR